MVKQHAQVMNFLLGVCDLAVIAAAWVAAFYLRFSMFPHDKGVPAWGGAGAGGGGGVGMNLLVALLVAILVLHGMGLYRPRRDKSFLLEIGQICKAGVLIWVILIALIYYTAQTPFTRIMLAIFLPLMIAGLILERGIFRSGLRFFRRRGWNLRHAVIVGTGRLGQATLLRLERNSWMGIRVAGMIDAEKNAGMEKSRTSEIQPAASRRTEPRRIRGVPVIGTVADVRQIVEQTAADCLFIALGAGENASLKKVLADLQNAAVDVRVVPDLFHARFGMRAQAEDLDGLPILSLRENPLAGWPGVYKRLFDLLGAAAGLFILALPMAAIAAAIKCHDGGPVFYRQRRVSYGRKAFWIMKFRTMRLDAEAGGPVFAAPGDPRCTRIGRFLRAWSLDELPQLFNVLRGEMSLVGPRPERPEMLERIEREAPGFGRRLNIRAGLTGWAQVRGFRGRTSFRKRLQYDLYYLNHWSPLLDVRIVAATLFRIRQEQAS